MNKTLADYACIALLLIGTAGVVASTFMRSGISQNESAVTFAIVILMACVAKSFIPDSENTDAR